MRKWHSTSHGKAHHIVTMFPRNGKRRSRIQRFSNRSFSCLSFFDARPSFEMALQIREPNAKAFRKSSWSPKLPDDPHCKKSVRAKPLARIFFVIFCLSACSRKVATGQFLQWNLKLNYDECEYRGMNGKTHIHFSNGKPLKEVSQATYVGGITQQQKHKNSVSMQ